jgi:hypothetical protein
MTGTRKNNYYTASPFLLAAPLLLAPSFCYHFCEYCSIFLLHLPTKWSSLLPQPTQLTGIMLASKFVKASKSHSMKKLALADHFFSQWTYRMPLQCENWSMDQTTIHSRPIHAYSWHGTWSQLWYASLRRHEGIPLPEQRNHHFPTQTECCPNGTFCELRLHASCTQRTLC